MIACVSLFNTNYTPLAKLTLEENRLEYCTTHGYLPFFPEFEDMPGATYPEIFKHLGFKKLEIILDVFEKNPHCEWVWFADCDGMVTNMKKPLEDIIAQLEGVGIMASSDCHGMNAGSILVKNLPLTRAYFKGILEVKDQKTWAHEQDAFKDTYESIQPKEFFIIAAQKVMNSYQYDLYPDAKPLEGYRHNLEAGDWKPGDFFIHWPGRTMAQRIEHYHRYAKEVIR